MKLRVTKCIQQENKFLTNVEYINGIEFYPEGKGGQLGDLGSIGSAQILKVNKEGNLFLDRELRLGEYEYLIDMNRRDEIGKNHTAQHLISAYLKQKYNFDTVGFRMGEEYSTVDFPSLDIDEEKIKDLEIAMNKMIIENYHVEILTYTHEEANQIKSLRKSISDKVIGDVKVVKIGDFDLNACGGFHVKQTKDIGLFKVINYEKTKKTITRIYYKAGNRCYEDYYKKHEIIKKATVQTSSTVDEVNDKIDYLLNDNKLKTKELSNLYQNYSELLCEKLKENAKIIGENKIIIYKKNDPATKFFPKFIDNEKYSLIYGENDNFTVISKAINCIELKENLEKIGYSVRGGGNSTRINLKIDINIEKIVDIFMKLL
ncbi:MAG TPA: alanyl-tRNA editing protein [Fusobacteriaceae bacterium]|nr:alanyl-tRNA editing protein [Fusobacteriaceae bacterium]